MKTCPPHHWMIDGQQKPDGRIGGTCKLCRKRRDFSAQFPAPGHFGQSLSAGKEKLCRRCGAHPRSRIHQQDCRGRSGGDA